MREYREGERGKEEERERVFKGKVRKLRSGTFQSEAGDVLTFNLDS